MARILSTLPGITNFQSGVGSSDDLLVKIKEDPDAGWFPLIRQGFYYIGTEEGYWFANKGERSFTDTTTGSINSLTVSGWITDPTTVGPVIMRRTGQVRVLQRVTSALRAFRPITFSGSDPLVASVPDSGILVQLCSQPVTGILLSVPSTGDIVGSEDYFYNQSLGNVYIRAVNPPSIFGTYVVGETDSSLLRQEEIHVVDTDGKIRTQFANVWYASGSTLNPVINKPTPGGLVSVTGSVVSGNVVTFDPTVGIVSGDVVAIQYYVRDSYTVVPSGSVAVVRYLLASSGDFTLDYELGTTWYDSSQASGSVNYLQLNPILEPRKSAFLYVVDDQEPYPAASTVAIAVSNYNPLYNPSGCAKVIVAVNAYDAELEPLPQQHLTISTAGASGSLALVVPVSGSTSSTSGITNGIGQVLYAWTLQGTGAVTITATVSGYPSASGSLAFKVRDVRYYDQDSEQRLGKLLMNMESTPLLGNLHRVNAYYCYRDGSPFVPSGQVVPYSTTVTFDADSSQFYSVDGLPQARPYTLPTDEDGIASILIDPVPGDVIRAFVQTPTSGRLRTAPIVIVPISAVETK